MHGLSHDHRWYPLKTRWAEKNTSATVVPDEKQLLSLVGRNEVLGEWSFSVLACFLRVRWVSAVLVLESNMHQTHYVQVHLSVDFLHLASYSGRIRRWRGSWASGRRGPCSEGSTEVRSVAVDFSHGKQRFSLFGFRLMKSWAQWKLCNPWRRNLPLGRIKDSMDFWTLGLVFCKHWVEFAGSCYHKLL